MMIMMMIIIIHIIIIITVIIAIIIIMIKSLSNVVLELCADTVNFFLVHMSYKYVYVFALCLQNN